MIGVLLINMGSPENIWDVRLFLRLMFMDKKIIPAPYIVRKFLSLYISTTRYKKSWEKYKKIGGSPLKNDTEKIAFLLQESLGNKFNVKIAFSYSKPFIKNSILELINEGISDIIAIPLYPQRSITTTDSVVFEINKTIELFKQVNIKIINEFYSNHLFVDFWKEAINYHIIKHNLNNPLLLFSAHSIPNSFIKKGDSYKYAVEESSRLIAESLGLNYKLSYQSGMNSKTWLGPDTNDVINKLALTNEKEIVLIPISFVSENLETLLDIDQVIIRNFKKKYPLINLSRVKIPVANKKFNELLKELVLINYNS